MDLFLFFWGYLEVGLLVSKIKIPSVWEGPVWPLHCESKDASPGGLATGELVFPVDPNLFNKSFLPTVLLASQNPSLMCTTEWRRIALSHLRAVYLLTATSPSLTGRFSKAQRWYLQWRRAVGIAWLLEEKDNVFRADLQQHKCCSFSLAKWCPQRFVPLFPCLRLKVCPWILLINPFSWARMQPLSVPIVCDPWALQGTQPLTSLLPKGVWAAQHPTESSSNTASAARAV